MHLQSFVLRNGHFAQSDLESLLALTSRLQKLNLISLRSKVWIEEDETDLAHISASTMTCLESHEIALQSFHFHWPTPPKPRLNASCSLYASIQPNGRSQHRTFCPSWSSDSRIQSTSLHVLRSITRTGQSSCRTVDSIGFCASHLIYCISKRFMQLTSWNIWMSTLELTYHCLLEGQDQEQDQEEAQPD